MSRQNDLLKLGIAAAILVALFYGGEKIVNAARGLRNNNPGNIRLSSTSWAGQVPRESQTDSDYVQFIEPVYGIRAMARILKNYAARGVDTVQEIIATWAPPSENNTTAYVTAVANNLGIAPTTVVSADKLPALIAAIIHHENGIQPYDAATLARGVAMA